MGKVRIFEWAKENKKQSAEIVRDLTEKGHKVRNHTSFVEENVLTEMYNKSEAVTPKKDVKKKEAPATNKPNRYVKETTDFTSKTDDKAKGNPATGGYKGTNPRPTTGGYKGTNPRPAGSGYQGNNPRPTTGGYKGNKPRPATGGYKGTNPRPAGGGYQGNSPRPATGGYKGTNPRPAAGGFNRNTGVKKEEETVKEETKKPVKKKTAVKKVKYDRFKFFDKEKKETLDNGKTKTQMKKEAREDRQKEKSQETTIIQWNEEITVASFAAKLGVPVTDIIAKLFELGIMTTVNQVLSRDVAEVLTTEYNIELAEDESNKELDFENLIPTFENAKVKKRPPIVTIMGHVDHGKTTLLDYLRNSNVTDKEAGGITQHIGAYQIVAKNKERITFLDTPGHEAFSAMRARGADITDISILVIAADDGVMPQTVEAITHIKAAKKPLIVAITKIDKPESNYEKILGELAENQIMAEEWGGEVPVVKISALTGEGIDDLLDYIKVISDLHEYTARYEGQGIGTVIEANLDRGRGPVATVLLESGELKLKDSIVIGDTWGTIRVLRDEYGVNHQQISPSMPVEITGLKEVPGAGERFFVAQNSKEAQALGEKRSAVKKAKERGNAHALSLEELNNLIEGGKVKELPVIIKSDVQGSSEALAASLEKIDVNGVKVRVVSKGVGAINESDVLLAAANKTIIIGFNVRADAGARKKIEKEKIELIVNNIIYKIIEQIEDSMLGMREKKYTEEVVGHAEVREIFKISDVGKVAGIYVTDGKINRENKLRLVREGIVLYDGEIGQLKRFKDDVNELVASQDGGISFSSYSDLKKGDELEAYVVEETVE